MTAMALVGERTLAEEVDALFCHDPDLIADPYLLYGRLREEAPAFRHADRVLVSRYEDARRVLAMPAVLQGIAVKGSRYRAAASRLDEEHRRRLLEMFEFLEKRLGGANGGRHLRLRRLAQAAFTPRMVAAMEEEVQEVTDWLLDPLAGRDVIEVVGEFAYHLPLIVVSEMLDISREDREDLRRWASDLGDFVGADWSDPDTVDRSHASVFRLRRYLHALFAERRGGPTTNLLGALLAASGGVEGGEDRFTDDELVAMVTQFVFAGHETTTNLIGNSLILLLGRERATWERMGGDPSIVPTVVEELLRFATPTQYVDKMAGEAMVVSGVPVQPWDTISVMLAAANRDASIFEEPELFLPERTGQPHLTFGFGAHHCIGAALARLEVCAALRTLSRRFPRAELVGDPVEWRRNHMLRGPERLSLLLGGDHG